MESEKACPRPDICPWENQAMHGAGDGCCFAPAPISTLSDITCTPLPPPVVLEGVGEPSILPDLTKPVVVKWPTTAQPSQQVQCPPGTVKANPPCYTEETVPVLTKVLQHPEGDIMKQTLNHPLCPDAQLTLTITPPVKKPLEIRIPECKVPSVRPPQRPWLQCVENQRISDKVRRPLARICHRRELPPVVISCDDYNRIQDRTTERQRKAAEREARCMDRECERLKSRYRHSLWNYTVESLLERKRKEQQEKETAAMESDKALIADLKAVKDAESAEAREKAQTMMLYRKGVIRDFHSAMATSKLMKDLADEGKQTDRCEQQAQESPPFLNKVCLQKMAWVNDRPEYEKRDTKQPCSKKLIELIEMDEKRVGERAAILQAEKMAAECLRTEEPLPYTEAYCKYIQEPTCDLEGSPETNEKCKKEAALRRQVFEEIQDRLCLDAFIEARENEQERQANCFNNYIRERNKLVKEKEKQLIEDKVRRNIEASEKAAAVLLEMQGQKKGRADVYNQLREQWEKDYEQKALNKKKDHAKRMGLVYKNFWEQRNIELCKRQMIDASRHWVREQMDAVSNYNMECEINETRKEKAEELALYHKAQMADKKCREDKAKHLDCVYGYKAKMAHEAEEKEMRTYAQKCIEDWAAKGRPVGPMIQAMKKWEYEGGMYPHRAIPTPCHNPQSRCPDYESSSNRLGFGSGGT